MLTKLSHRPKILSEKEVKESVLPLMQLAQSHFTSQALNAVVQLGIPDIIGDQTLTIDEIVSELLDSVEDANKEALLRTMRLLCSVGVFYEDAPPHEEIVFGLAPAGALLQTTCTNSSLPSMASFVSHWTETPMWNAWSELGGYIAGKHATNPFEVANGQSLVDFYTDNPQSAQHRNAVAKFVSSGEIPAILDSFDWASLQNKTVVDIGGGYGDMMNAISKAYPNIKCICLDLPDVIANAQPTTSESVQLVSGDMFDPSSIPPCDAICMKHVLCDWSDDDATTILENIHSALPSGGIVILLDALLPSGQEAFNSRHIQVFIDALLMIVGGRMERSQSQLSKVANAAGFQIDLVKGTASPSVNITVLSKIQYSII
jgi:SAM-dependent methyltransferase